METLGCRMPLLAELFFALLHTRPVDKTIRSTKALQIRAKTRGCSFSRVVTLHWHWGVSSTPEIVPYPQVSPLFPHFYTKSTQLPRTGYAMHVVPHPVAPMICAILLGLCRMKWSSQALIRCTVLVYVNDMTSVTGVWHLFLSRLQTCAVGVEAARALIGRGSRKWLPRWNTHVLR